MHTRNFVGIVLVLGSCTKDSGMPPGALGACHKADFVAACTGPAPDQLGSRALANGFLSDAEASHGLGGVFGRRVAFGDVNGDGYPDFITVQSGVTPGLQSLHVYDPAARMYRD